MLLITITRKEYFVSYSTAAFTYLVGIKFNSTAGTYHYMSDSTTVDTSVIQIYDIIDNLDVFRVNGDCVLAREATNQLYDNVNCAATCGFV